MDLCKSHIVLNNQMSHTSHKAASGKNKLWKCMGLKFSSEKCLLSNIIFYNEIKILSNVSGYIKKESSMIMILKSLKGETETR